MRDQPRPRALVALSPSFVARSVATALGAVLMFGSAHTATAGPGTQPDDPRPPAFQVLNPRIPVGAIRFLGWSAHSNRFAWQQARPGTRVRPTGPVWVVRLDRRGHVEQRAHFVDRIEVRLRKRGIRQRPPSVLPTDAVTPRDVVVKTRRGELLAVALRDRARDGATVEPPPPWIAVLHRLQGGYAPVAGLDAPGAKVPLRVEAWESPDGRRVLLAIAAGEGNAARMWLATLPLGKWLPRSRTERAIEVPAPAPGAAGDGAVASPAAASPTTAEAATPSAEGAGAVKAAETDPPKGAARPAPSQRAQPSKSP